MNEDGEFMKKSGYHQATKRMINVLTIALKIGVDFLFGKM